MKKCFLITRDLCSLRYAPLKKWRKRSKKNQNNSRNKQKKSHLGFWSNLGYCIRRTVWICSVISGRFLFFGRCQLRVVGANLSILTHIIMTQKCMTRQKYPNSQSEHFERLISKDFQKISHKTNQLFQFTPKIFSLFQDSFLPNEIF